MRRHTDYTDRALRASVLSEIIQRHKLRRGAEIGVDAGRLTLRLLRMNPRLHLIAVDSWPADYPDGPYERGEGPARGEAKQALKRKRFLKAMRPFGSRVRLIDKLSIEAAEEVGNGALDFVFLDADHSYEGVMADIMSWTPKVRKGGYMSGHDYSEQHFPGLVRAVNEAFPEGMFILPDFIWCVQV